MRRSLFVGGALAVCFVTGASAGLADQTIKMYSKQGGLKAKDKAILVGSRATVNNGGTNEYHGAFFRVPNDRSQPVVIGDMYNKVGAYNRGDVFKIANNSARLESGKDETGAPLFVEASYTDTTSGANGGDNVLLVTNCQLDFNMTARGAYNFTKGASSSVTVKFVAMKNGWTDMINQGQMMMMHPKTYTASSNNNMDAKFIYPDTGWANPNCCAYVAGSNATEQPSASGDCYL